MIEQLERAKELRQMAARMEALALAIEQDVPEIAREVVKVLSRSDRYLAGLAQTWYKERRLRNEVLGKELFCEPAWDMLLDLFVQQEQGRKISITSACIASDSAQTTALRWIEILIAKGLLDKRTDETDCRRSWLTLTEDGLTKMREVLRARAPEY
ncbi:hypothetical protein [Alteripontixanthobacter maritimus]|uniref:hypothetical protein n=1 Tax=Alteripontixanthobacter maritimus TaxID=2161824 RepID=UPI0015F1035A|nr:hypothetical protein [Alteripontixanthobacter maritimus]